MISAWKKETLDLAAPVWKFEKQAIMARSEEKVIKASIHALCAVVSPLSVLEIGFGMGFTASVFREYVPDCHRIVEVHPQIAQDAREKGFQVVEKAIQEYRDDRHYTLIYDDHYPFKGEPLPDWANFRHLFRAGLFDVYTGQSRDGFRFSVDGADYWQPLLDNRKGGKR